MLLFQQKKIYIFIPSNSFKLSEAPEVNGIKYQMTAEALGLITCAWQGMERKHLSVTSQILHTICGVHAYVHAHAHTQSTLTLSPIQNNFYLFIFFWWYEQFIHQEPLCQSRAMFGLPLLPCTGVSDK